MDDEQENLVSFHHSFSEVGEKSVNLSSSHRVASIRGRTTKDDALIEEQLSQHPFDVDVIITQPQQQVKKVDVHETTDEHVRIDRESFSQIITNCVFGVLVKCCL